MKLKQYPKYKDSGVQWIGEIPEEWEVKKVKHFSISIAGGTPDTTNTEYWDGNVPWLPSGMVHDKSISE
ncbi:restriction endonuclease subunit S, partial [Candidatus Woesearchaeota archaeon]|nr:restriction endonuclease subunit S [Candidatus Woesearchaeota archaeon]